MKLSYSDSNHLLTTSESILQLNRPGGLKFIWNIFVLCWRNGRIILNIVITEGPRHRVKDVEARLTKLPSVINKITADGYWGVDVVGGWFSTADAEFFHITLPDVNSP